MGDIKWRDDTVTDENMNEIDPDYRFGTRAREKVTEAAGNTLEWLNNQPGTYLPDFDGNPETKGLQIAPSGEQILQGLQIGGKVIGNVTNYIDDEVFLGAGKELGKLKTKGDDALYQALDDKGIKVDRDWLGFTTGAALAGAEEGLLGPIAKVPKILTNIPFKPTNTWLDRIFASRRFAPDGPNGINTVRNQPLDIDGNPNIMKSTSGSGGGSKLFKGDSVKANNFVSRGNLYAQGSLNKGRKNNLLKGWNNKITDDNGVDFMLVRGRNNKFNLRPVHDVELDLLKKSGYTGTAKEMNKIRSEINRALGNRPGTRYWEILSEGDKNTYIEHLVAKGQHWFWKLPHSQRSWSPPSRNTAFNLRIVNNQRYKKLKDRIETIVYPQNYVNPEKALSFTEEGIPVYTGKLKPELKSRLIIHVEDPLTTTTNLAAKDKKLLGHLTIRRANDGKVIGKFGDYLDAIYSPTFEDGLRKAGLLKTGENITDWRTNFLTEKFNFIQSQAPLLDERAKKIVHKYAGHKNPMEAARSAVIDEALVDDLTAFKARFPWADIPPGLLNHYRRNLSL